MAIAMPIARLLYSCCCCYCDDDDDDDTIKYHLRCHRMVAIGLNYSVASPLAPANLDYSENL